ncbi:M20 family metallopeptidase [Planococcus shixiaomingii]|uniref:M20 family metallopeptidase n=1 Tax=Planococcus shixiaomingii TaxID=3058393 RepID=UPI00260920E0|nr:M20 family metallopeptidase [Planococcus sp. N022]WKA55434.1 M20 family metallopeptidase [Planococcus sp. N022]
MKKVIEQIEKNHEQMFHYLRNIVEQESFSADKERLDSLALWLSDTFKELIGGKTEIIEVEKYGNHVRCEWGEGDGQILILSHFDTVWPIGTLKKMPFRVEGDRVSGPGVFDMKGGLIQGVFALKAIRDAGIALSKKVVVLFDSDEEIGNPSSRFYIEQEAKKSDRVFVLEPGMTIEGGLKTARKGVGIYRMEVTGIPSHSGVDPEKGVSAIDELAHQIIWLHGQTDFTTGTTINVGKISGGSATNVIAEKAVAEIDVRGKTTEELERVHNMLMELEPLNERTKLIMSGDINRMPLERTEHVQEMFQTAKRIAKEHLGVELVEKETGGGSDGNLTAPFAPTLDGLGAVGDGAHANHEHLLLSRMNERCALLAGLIMNYAGVQKEEGVEAEQSRRS